MLRVRVCGSVLPVDVRLSIQGHEGRQRKQEERGEAHAFLLTRGMMFYVLICKSVRHNIENSKKHAFIRGFRSFFLLNPIYVNTLETTSNDVVPMPSP